VQFSVTANTNNISNIELHSTGGLLTNVTGQSSAVFSVSSLYMGPGLHPFYAIVTAPNGKQYRTETKWIRFTGATEPAFTVLFTNPPPTLLWPATAGRTYDVLSATNVAGTFQLRASVTASNETGQWVETDASAPQRFYRVRTSN